MYNIDTYIGGILVKDINRRIGSFFLALSIVISSTGCQGKNNLKDIDMLSYGDGPEVKRASLTNLVQAEMDNINQTGLEDIYGLNSRIESVLLNGNGLCTYDYQGDIDSLLRGIIQNSREYAKEYPEYLALFDEKVYASEYTNYYGVLFDKEKLGEIRENILVFLESYISYVYGNGTKEDIHNLVDLKIVIYTDEVANNSTAFGEYDNKEKLVRINFYKILNMAWETGDIFARIDEVLKHELNHALEHSCPDKLESTNQDEVAFLNGDNYSFITEASAESSLYNLGISSGYENKASVFYYTYDNLRNLEVKLLLCSMFQNSKSLEEYYQRINDEDINGLLEVLGAETLEEKQELFRVVYSMDALVGRNNYPIELLGKKKEYSRKDIFKLVDKISFKHYISILKYSVESLMKYNINEELLSLDDNLLVYYIVVSNILDECYLLDESEDYKIYYYYQGFIEEYNLIEENYFRMLGSIYRKDVSEIRNRYKTFKKVNINRQLSYLSQGCDEDKEICMVNGYDLNERLEKLLERFPKLKVIANIRYYDGVSSYDYVKMFDNVRNPDNEDMTLRLRK